MNDVLPAGFGRYRVLDELGRGAMGVVYKAQDPMLDRTVAIKVIVLSADAAERAEYEARFMQEAKAAGRLSHPAIITIYDVGREGELAYMAMELLQGTNLRQRLAGGRLPLAQVIDLTAQIADGLAFAHEHGVVHRDIKPANIMIVRGERPKIMDFGIARLAVSEIKTQAGMLLGTPRYMSPEQVAGRAVDHRSDLFSLGSVLCEMLTGAAPFTGADSTQVLFNVASAQHVAPGRLNLQVPPMLDLVVAKALQKDPEARYQSGHELAADLRASLAELPDHLSRVAATATEATISLTDPTVRLDGAGATETAVAATRHSGPATARLPLSRRFDSSKALTRLVQPSQADRTLLSRPPAARHSLLSLWRDRQRRWLVALLGVAALAAAAIAFV